MYRREIGLIAAVLSISVSVGFGLSMAPSAFAQSQGDTKNDFGEGAAGGCADPLGCGQHSSNQEEPRHGIGNVGQEVVCPDTTQKILPDQLARILTAQEQCPP